MVKTAVFGDVHGCYPALIDMLAVAIKRKNVDRLVWLGDIVGYGPNPVECIDIAKYFTGINTNRYVLKGNHDLYFHTGEFFGNVDKFAVESTRWAWQHFFEIKNPKELAEATQRLQKGIQRGVRLPEKPIPIKWFEWVIFPIGLYKLAKKHVRLGSIPHEEIPGLLESMPDENMPAVAEYASSRVKKEKVDEYFSFLSGLEKELAFPEEKLMFAHSFPQSMAKHAERLGIDKEYIDRMEVYVVSKNEWDAKYQRKREEYKNENINNIEAALKDLKRKHAIAEELVELLPEGTTLFLGHNHEPLICDSKTGKGSRIIIPGSVFKPRNPKDNIARFLIYDDRSPNNITFINVPYDREKVNKEMEEAGLAKFFNK